MTDDAPLVPYDAGDPAQVAERKKNAKQQERERIETLKAMLSHRNGRTWLHWLLTECHIWRTSYSGNALQMALREGERNIGLKVLGDVHAADPDNYALMIKENANG